MAKKRKTRSQKYSADLRHQVHSQSPTPLSTISLNDIGIKPSEVTRKTISPSSQPHLEEYTYVKHDLRKTSLITGAIILVELVLFFVVKP
jgi:hypothetical protein